MHIVIRSDRAQTVTGLAVFAEGEEREFSIDEIEGYQLIMGIPFHPDNLPDGVEVISVVVGEEE